MLKYLQEQYFMHLNLSQMKKVSTDKYNFRADYCCGDSLKNKNKKRGWLLWNQRYDTWVYSCFNCGVSTNFHKVLKDTNESVYQEYKSLERKEQLDLYIKPKKIVKVRDTIKLENLPDDVVLCNTDEGKECKDYLEKRKIPKMFINKWYYSKEYGLVVPFEYSDKSIIGWQGRKLDKKYFHTSLPEGNPKIWNWYSVDKSRDVYITESIIDSTMLYLINQQSIAISGADVKAEYVYELDKPIFIFDNDETGDRKREKYSKLFPQAKFLVWNKRIKQKDLNEIICTGVGLDKFQKFISTSLVSGLELSIKNQLMKVV